MSKAVLISIRPEWCKKIAIGRKTMELRKSKPKLTPPFKCYIYMTKTGHLVTKIMPSGNVVELNYKIAGKVIGEFVCDGAIPMSIKYSNPDSYLALKEFPYTCMTDKQIIDYLGNGGDGYGWHISELKIYDTPKELSEFVKPFNFRSCLHPIAIDCGECTKCIIKRPPQSWCYVEELT